MPLRPSRKKIIIGVVLAAVALTILEGNRRAGLEREIVGLFDDLKAGSSASSLSELSLWSYRFDGTAHFEIPAAAPESARVRGLLENRGWTINGKNFSGEGGSLSAEKSNYRVTVFYTPERVMFSGSTW